MNFNDYLEFIRKYIYVTIILILFIVSYSLFQSKKNPFIYSGSITFTIGNKLNVANDATGYNNYYSLTTSSILSETIVGWISSPNIVSKIYQEAGYPISNDKISNLEKKIHYNRPTSMSNVVIAMVEGDSNEETNSILVSTKKVINEQLSNLESQSAAPPGLTIISSEPTVLSKKVNSLSSIIIGAIAGLILGFIVSLVIGAIKENNN